MKKYSGKTLEEALEKASEEENASIENLNYTIFEEKKGLFSKKVEILVFDLRDVVEFSSEYIKTIIGSLGLEVEIKEALRDGIILLTINTSHNSILIGKNGRTLQALNDLVRNAVNNHFRKRYRILLDINQYKDEKYEKLTHLAKKIAREVGQSKAAVRLDPMPADERRVVHNVISNYNNVVSQSDGVGNKRHIVVSYKGQKN